MSWLPTFTLPTLPSLPSISLPEHLQRRFISYLLRRSLGHIIKPTSLDFDKIDAQISDGRIQLEVLELDEKAVMRWLPQGLGVRCSGGRVEGCLVRLPVPNLWTAPFSFKVDRIVIELEVCDRSPGGTPNPQEQAVPPGLEDSLLDVSQAFVQSDLTPRDLQALHANSAPSDISIDPFSFDDIENSDPIAPGGFPSSSSSTSSTSGPSTKTPDSTDQPSSIFASILEGLLARLTVDVGEVRIRLKHVQTGGQKGNRDGRGRRGREIGYELRMDGIGYRTQVIGSLSSMEDRSTGSGTGPRPGHPSSPTGSETARIVTVRDISGWMTIDHPPATSSPPGNPFNTLTSRNRRRSLSSSSTNLSRSITPTRDRTRSRVLSPRSSLENSINSQTTMAESAHSAHHPSPGTRRDVIPDSDSDEEIEAEDGMDLDDMMMSRGIADLRESVMGLGEVGLGRTDRTGHERGGFGQVEEEEEGDGEDGAESMYESAVDHTEGERLGFEAEPPDQHIPNSLSWHASQAAEPIRSPPASEATKIFSFGKDGISIRMTTRQTEHGLAPWTEVEAGDISLALGRDELLGMLETGCTLGQSEVGVSEAVNKSEGRPIARERDAHLGLRVRSVEVNGRYTGPPLTTVRRATDTSDSLTLRITGIAAEQVILNGARRGSLTIQALDLEETSAGLATKIFGFDHGISEDYTLKRVAEETVDKGRDGWSRRVSFSRWPARSGPGKALSNAALVAERLGPSTILEPAMSLERTSNGVVIGARPFQLSVDTCVITRVLPFLQQVSHHLELLHTPSKHHKHHVTARPHRASPITVELELARVLVFGPAIPGDGVGSRSGNVIVDLHDIGLSGSDAEGKSSGDRGVAISLGTAIVFHEAVNAADAQSVVIIGRLSHADDISPSAAVTLTWSGDGLESPASPSMGIDSVQIFVDRSAAEGMQYLANDMASWLDAQMQDSDSSPRRDLKMIGSRFFAPPAVPDSGSSTSSENEDTYGAVGSIKIGILRGQLRSTSGSDAINDLVLMAEDLVISARTAPDIHGVGAKISMQEVRLSEATVESHVGIVWSARSAASGMPCVTIDLSSRTIPLQQIKEASTKVEIVDLDFWLDPGSECWQRARLTLKPPKGLFQDMLPSDVSSIALHLTKCTLYSIDGHSRASLGLVLEDIFVRTRLVADAMETVTKVDISAAQTVAIDIAPLNLANRLAEGDSWTVIGFQELLRLDGARLSLRQNKITESMQVDIVGGHADLSLAADSRATLLHNGSNIMRAWTDKGNKASPALSTEQEHTPQRPFKTSLSGTPSTSRTADVFKSVDAEAFAVRNTAMSADLGRSDLLEDDIPFHPGYLDGRSKEDGGRHDHERVQRNPPEQDDECHIEILNDTPFALWTRYYSDLEDQADNAPAASAGARFHLSLRSLDLTFHLFDGYDWAGTRSRIGDEVKAMRRNLIKLRQALASGQKPQEPTSVSETYLYDSMLIGLPEEADLDDPAEALDAIDEELELFGDNASDHFSTHVGQSSHPASPRQASSRSGHTHRKLTRSSKHQIAWAFKDVALDVTSYQPGRLQASRINFDCGDMQIIDHIRTSTWKSFLTEWRPDRQSSMREAEARFLRVELVDFMQPGGEDAESRLRIKVLPLRFHIDQDAVGFLNRFFSFDSTQPVVTADEKRSVKPVPGRFFQHVEIFPIEVKMDYKPKRVDLKALSKGKLAELLNLFNFEGSKMVLRHVTLNGVSGWGTVYSKLCEVWAPDITANQLSDVAAGVAPIRSVVNIGTGMADLILLPISQYRRSGHLAKGMQKGTARLANKTASEALSVGLQIATGTQIILEKASSALGASFDEPMDVETMEDSVILTKEANKGSRAHSRYANQPENAAQGMVAAYQSLAKNVSSAAQTILAVPMEVYESTGDQSPAKMVVRAVPIAMLKTMIGVTDASRQAMFGLKNEFRHGVRADMDAKYKDDLRK